MTYNNIKKAESFTVLLQSNVNQPPSQQLCTNSTYKIAKDNGNFVTATNKGVFVAIGVQRLTLTAEEMNANLIEVVGYYPGSPYEYSASVTINTGFSNSGANSSYVSSTINALISKGYTISDIARDVNGYNYYGLKPSANGWFIIIKEKTDFTTVGYYMKYNVSLYDDKWADKENLNYKSTINLKNIK